MKKQKVLIILIISVLFALKSYGQNQTLKIKNEIAADFKVELSYNLDGEHQQLGSGIIHWGGKKNMSIPQAATGLKIFIYMVIAGDNVRMNEYKDMFGDDLPFDQTKIRLHGTINRRKLTITNPQTGELWFPSID